MLDFAAIVGTLIFALSGVGASSAAASVTPTSGLGTGGPGPTIPANAAAITKLWTANSRTYKERPDGPYITIFYVQPINVKGPEGAWKPIEGTTIPGEAATPSGASAPHIDASVTLGASQDCSLISNKPTESSCGATSDKVGWDGADTDNTLIQFNIKEALAPDANVLNAELGMYLSGSSTSNAVSVSAYAALKPWTTSATWNTYDGTHAWTEAGAEKAGSDYTTTNSVLNGSVVGPPGWAHWYPTQVAQEWANGTIENHGLVLADTTQRQTNDALTFNSSRAGSNKPYLTISWTPRGQEDPTAYTMQPFPIDESSTMKVNLASGDLFVNSNDLSVTPKAGPPLLAEHNYDSRDTEGGTVNPWYSLPGASVYHDGSVAIGINRYDFEPFILQSNGTFLTPRGIDATLCKINGTTCKGNAIDGSKPAYALTFNHNGNGPLYREGYKMDFDSNGGVWSIADASGNAIVWNYEGKLKLKDGEGHTFTRNTTEVAGFKVTSSWVESGGGSREVKYAYNSDGRLETYTDAEGHKTKYVYDKDGELSEITAPNGTVTKLYYTADKSRRITKIEGAEEDGSKGTWEYTYYEVGKAPAPCTASQKATVVAETNGNEEPPITYCSNVWDEVEKVAGYPQTGQPGWYVLEDEADSEFARASVNLASGNLLIKSEDVAPEEEDKNTAVDRFYNAQATQTHAALGSRWHLGTGPRVYAVDYGSMVAVHGPSGYTALLNRTPTGTYTATEGFEGTLSKNASGTYTLINENNPTYEFNTVGVLTSETSDEGNVFTVGDTVIGGKNVLHSLAPASGKAFEAKYDSTPHLIESTDPASHTRHYEYDASGRLKTYTDASGGKTQYEYEAAGNLSKITMPDETVETITTLGGKASEVSVTPPGGEASGARFSYQTPAAPTCNPSTDAVETVVTAVPGGTEERYCFDALGHFTGPKTTGETEEEEGSGTPPETPAETCEEDPELHKEDCALEEEPPEDPERLQPKNYGLADSAWLQGRSIGHPFFNYLADTHIKAMNVDEYRRTVAWNMITEAERQEKDPKKETNPGALANLEDVEEWITSVKEAGGEPYVSFDNLCSYPPPPWDDPRELSKTEEEADDHPCSQAPSKAQYKAAVEKFLHPVAGPIRSHADLAEVRFFTAMNEPNLISLNSHGEHLRPTWSAEGHAYPGGPNGAHLAGEYWRALSDLCAKTVREAEKRPPCYAAAGEFSDTDMMNAYNGRGSAYFKEYLGGVGKGPKAYRWAWHAYTDGSESQARYASRPKRWWSRFHNFVKRVERALEHTKYPRWEIWLTEQGVLYLGHKAATQAWKKRSTAENILDAYVKDGGYQLTRQSNHITRFFYYASRGEEEFDTGLLEAAKLPEGLKPPFLSPKKFTPNYPRAIYRIYKQKTEKS